MSAPVELHDLKVQLEGDPAASVERGLAILEHFGATPCPAAPPDLRIAFTVEPPSEAARPPETARHLDMTIHRGEGDLWLCSPSTTSRVSPTGELARIASHDGQPIPLHVFTCVLFHQLRARGRYALHAATMSRNGRGVLVVGPSGSGKSTLTLALGRLGWDRVSDDSILLERSAAGLRALALRRGIYLDPTTLLELPAGARWRPCPLVEAVKQELVLEATSRAATTTPALILLPEIADHDHTTIEPVDPVDACWALAAESRLGELDRTDAAEHLTLLCDLAARTPAVRARLGRDVLRAAPELSDRLERLVLETPPDLPPTPPRPARPFDMRRPIYAPLPPDRGVLLHPESLDLFALDRTGARIWELATDLPIPSIAQTLAAELDASAVDLQAEVQHFLDDLAADGFVPHPTETLR
jgi:hypothetical protein